MEISKVVTKKMEIRKCPRCGRKWQSSNGTWWYATSKTECYDNPLFDDVVCGCRICMHTDPPIDLVRIYVIETFDYQRIADFLAWVDDLDPDEYSSIVKDVFGRHLITAICRCDTPHALLALRTLCEHIPTLEADLAEYAQGLSGWEKFVYEYSAMIRRKVAPKY